MGSELNIYARILPQELRHCQRLRHSRLSFNELSDIPTWVGDLLDLEELLLQDNQIENLPHDLVRLTALTRLELSGNPLTGMDLNVQMGGVARIMEFLSLNSVYDQVFSDAPTGVRREDHCIDYSPPQQWATGEGLRRRVLIDRRALSRAERERSKRADRELLGRRNEFASVAVLAGQSDTRDAR